MANKVNRKNVFWWQMRRFVITTIIGGLVVVLPITIFVALVRLVFNFIASLIAPIGRLLNFSEDVSQTLINLLSFVIVISAFFLIGLIVRTELGSKFFKHLEESFLIQLPLYRVIRDTVRQFIGVDKMPFSQVVLADVFGDGVWMTGFVTDEHNNGYFTIFVPTAPNPTNGFVFHIHESKIKFLESKTEDAMTSIIGLGIGSKVLFSAKEKGKKSNLPPKPDSAS
ncbi:MAG: DUF502 domain-containing protein [Saprospiraceae bacterium]|nr:DUF502 domain-containing protein [Saprospiraceae bacterium]